MVRNDVPPVSLGSSQSTLVCDADLAEIPLTLTTGRARLGRCAA
jgi:hypothetical protein